MPLWGFSLACEAGDEELMELVKAAMAVFESLESLLTGVRG